jgi:hypothetical protein
VPAGLADRAARYEETRAGEITALDGLANAPVGPARVPHRREAPIEHGAHERRGARGQERERHGLERPDVDLRQEDMDVAVDQARHERPAAHVDAGRAGGADRPGRDLPDPVALDEDRHAVQEIGGRRVEELRVLEQGQRHTAAPLGPRRGPPALSVGAVDGRNGRGSAAPGP